MKERDGEGRMSRKMIAIAHSLSEGNMLCDTRVEVLLLDVVEDVTESFRVPTRVHA